MVASSMQSGLNRSQLPDTVLSISAVLRQLKCAVHIGAVAIFHPNSATCLDMVAWGLWYYKVLHAHCTVKSIYQSTMLFL